MSHEIENNTRFYSHTRSPAWHGLGYVSETAMSIDEALIAADMDFDRTSTPYTRPSSTRTVSITSRYRRSTPLSGPTTATTSVLPTALSVRVHGRALCEREPVR